MEKRRRTNIKCGNIFKGGSKAASGEALTDLWLSLLERERKKREEEEDGGTRGAL